MAQRADRRRTHAEAGACQPRGGLVAHEVVPRVGALDGIGVAGIVLHGEGGPAAGHRVQRLVDADAQRGDAGDDHVGIHVVEQRPRGGQQRRRVLARPHVRGAARQRERDAVPGDGVQTLAGRATGGDRQRHARLRGERGGQRRQLPGGAGIPRGEEHARRHGARPPATTASARAQSSGVSMSMASSALVASPRMRGGNSRPWRASASRVIR